MLPLWYMRQILFLLPLLFLFVPTIVFGADGLVACTGVVDPDDPESIACGTCELVTTINNVIRFGVTIASIVATIALVVSGLKLVTSGGNTDGMKQVKGTLWAIIIGFFLIIASYAIVDVIIRALTDNEDIRNWRSFNLCIDQASPNYSEIYNANAVAGDVGGYGALGAGSYTGPLPQCQPGNTACSVEALQRAGFTESQANVMSCIAITESSGNPNIGPYNERHPESDSSACGLFQVVRTTWNSYATGACSDFRSNCTNQACNKQVALALVRNNQYRDWTCPNCNNKAAACVMRYR